MHDEHDHMENVSLHMISVGFVWLPSITLYNVDTLGLIMVEERTVKLEIFPGGFLCLLPPALICKIFNPVTFLSRVNDYIEPIAIFITWTKTYSTKFNISVMQGQLGWAKSYSQVKTFSCMVFTLG